MDEIRLVISGLKIHSTKDLQSPLARLCMMLYADPKVGKTEFAAGLDAFTQKYYGKRTLMICVEAAEGSGAASLAYKDIPYVTPKDYKELTSLMGALKTDKEFAGVVFDNITDAVDRILKPISLTQPAKQATSVRSQFGVPCRDDYQNMGEMGRQFVNKLINLTTLEKADGTPDIERRKHILCIALQRENFDGDGGLLSISPALPGQLSDAIPAMFNTVGTIQKKSLAVLKDPSDPKAGTQILQKRIFYVRPPQDKMVCDDRTKVFPSEVPITTDKGEPVGLDVLMENYWVPKMGMEKK